MLAYREVLKSFRPESEVTDTSCGEEIKYLRTDRDTDMRSDSSRYRSFSECNDLYPAPLYFLQTLLSQAGFYYVGPGDRVRCFSCGGELENWEYWDVPLTRHQRSFPDCPYVLEPEAEMSPIFGQYQYPRKESLLFPMRERLSQTVPSSSNCPTVQGQIKDPDYSKVEFITEGESETSAPPSGSSISGQKPLGTMIDENNRLETYRGHRHHFPRYNQRSLSQAGFYYVGPGDRVRCFSCGGELENWQPGDEPLTRHQQSYPGCLYVRGKMGIDPGIVGPMQKLSLKDQPVCPEMAEEWNRLATYRSGPWYPGEEPESAQSGIKINPPPGIRGTSVYEKQVPFPGGSFHPGTFPGQILPVPVMFTLQPGPTGGDVLFPGPFLPTLQSGPKVGGVDPQVLQMKGSSTAAGVGPSVYEPQGSIKGGDVQHQGLFPAGNIFYPVPFVTTLLPDPTVTEILFPVTLQPGPTVGGVDPQAQNMKRSSADQEKASSAAMEGGASGVQEVSSIYWLRGSTVECELCEKIPPIIHFTTSMLGHTYRAHLPWKGLFRCIETGIQFFVNTPALIDFELVSWGNYLKSLQEKSIETVGPLFNIRVLSGQVSAVYLPHYVCLKDRDVDVKKFKIVHYNAKGMTLESPSKIEPFYVALENPTFSFIGVVYKVASLFRTKIPAHGAVFIYGRFIKGYTIHLYFMPQDPLVKQAVHKKETDNGFFWLDKPPRTKTVYTRKKYVIQGPESAKIDPEDLKLRFDAEPEMYNYSEIYLPSVDEDILLEVTSERDEKSVWHALLRKEELMPGQPMAGGQHFVDKHRTELIERISNIDPVLDDLLGAQILTQEQYDKVRSNSTCQERMRQLYDCVRAWGSNQKDVFFRSIEQHNPHLIRDLKSK